VKSGIGPLPALPRRASSGSLRRSTGGFAADASPREQDGHCRRLAGVRGTVTVPLQRLLAALGLRPDDEAPRADTPLLRRLQDELSRRGVERLEYLAAFAGQLARVAGVEGGISAEETAAIAARLRAAGNLGEADAALIAEMLRHERDGLAAVDAHELRRAINASATPDEKQALLDCLYAVAAADHLVSDVEEQEIRRVAEAILVPHRVLMEIRSRYRDRLEALQNLPR
jgi:uncharacterized tellurite resistance protein B-like protein